MTSMLECFHCEEPGHWAQDCPLLQPPADKAEHEKRFTEIKRRFLDLEIGPVAKARMIKTENALWVKQQKELVK